MGRSVSSRTLVKKFPPHILDGQCWAHHGQRRDAYLIPVVGHQLWHYAVVNHRAVRIAKSDMPISASELAIAFSAAGIRADKVHWFVYDEYQAIADGDPNPFRDRVNSPRLFSLEGTMKRRHRLDRSEELGKLYVIHAAGTEFVKIGWASRVGVRKQLLQIGCPFELKTILIIHRRLVADEQALHARFRDYHVRGEWYRCDGELLDFIIQTSREQKECRSASIE